jgi:primase-polymerase (primpol)-like protein
MIKELVQVREKQIEDRDLKIKEIGEQLAGKEIFIEEIKDQLEDLKTISNQQNDTLDLNKIEMQSLKNELALIYTSNSWRYTRYARKLKLKFRGSKKLN